MIIEDQYGVGDLVDVGPGHRHRRGGGAARSPGCATDRHGLVRAQRRDPPGRQPLPGLDARHRRHPRSAYDENIDRVRDIVDSVANDMDEDPTYDDMLLGRPMFAGVESVSGEAVVIRITAKAVPDQQIPLARTIRERMKLAFDRAGITVPVLMRPLSGTAGFDESPEDGLMTPAACLVTGATGYVGGRLVPQLLAQGHRVRVMARHPEKLRDCPGSTTSRWSPATPATRRPCAARWPAMDVAYYLLHSIQEGPGLEDTERRMAQTFADAAREQRPAPHRVPRRARSRDPRSPDVAAHAVARRGRAGAARLGRAGRRVPGRRHHRLGVGQLRDAALPHRAAAGDDHADVGAAADPAHRHPRRPALPRRGGRPARRRSAGRSRSAGPRCSPTSR